jgi:CHAT domain-containing protein
MKRGETKPALAETERALGCFPSGNSEWYWRFTILKAELLWRQGSSRQSLDLLAKEPPASMATSDVPIRRDLALATANIFTQHLPEADRLLAEAEALASSKHPEFLGEIALRRGTARYLAVEMEQAQAAYQDALRAARESKDRFLEGSALEGLGVVATAKEHYDEAVDWDHAASDLARALGAQRLLEETLGNMGWCYLELGDFESALTLYQQAEATSAQIGAIGDQVYWLTGIETVYYRQHDYTGAQNVLQQGLDLARRQDDKATLTEFLNDFAEIVVETGQFDLAAKYLDEASEVEKASPDQAGALGSLLIRGRYLEKKRDYAGAENCFRQLIADPKSNSPQKWEAEADLAKVYAEQGQGVKAENEFHRSLDTIEAARSSVQTEELRVSFLASALSFYEDYIEFLIAHRRVQDALQVAELSRSRTLAEGLGAKPVSLSSHKFQPQQIAKHLNSVLLFYWVGQNHSYLWVIAPTKLSYFTLPKQSDIDPMVKAYRQSILDGRDALTSSDANGKQLYEALVAPAREAIPHGSPVILLPAESLYGLNFETLIVPNPSPHYWIEDVTLSEAGSLALLSAAIQKAGRRERSLLLVGNPEPADPSFPALAQAPAEMKRVSAHFPSPECTVLQGQHATASAYLKSDPEQFTYLHFVTHGTASHTRPLESALILTKEADSYKLYAREIIAHPLKAQLVTISACNGAGTRAYAGEGLVGLSWAFLRAGARNVVASLWEVSDASSTAQLMDELYAGLDRGEDPATALRNAKLFILKSNANTVFRKPFYWAPFQLYVGS